MPALSIGDDPLHEELQSLTKYHGIAEKVIFHGNKTQRELAVHNKADLFVPEWNSVASDGDKAATNGTAMAILQGRKYGMGCLLITQRTANVTKTILNQCNTIFAMRSFDQTGKDFLSDYIGKEYAEKLSLLQERHAVFFGKASSCENPVMIRLNDRDKFIEAFRRENPLPDLSGTTDVTQSDLTGTIDDTPPDETGTIDDTPPEDAGDGASNDDDWMNS